MSRSHKDGRRGGAHRNAQGREVWSARCRLVAMWDWSATGWKRITHRYERRQARREIAALLPPTRP